MGGTKCVYVSVLCAAEFLQGEGQVGQGKQARYNVLVADKLCYGRDKMCICVYTMRC